jgi:hypothetical protein
MEGVVGLDDVEALGIVGESRSLRNILGMDALTPVILSIVRFDDGGTVRIESGVPEEPTNSSVIPKRRASIRPKGLALRDSSCRRAERGSGEAGAVRGAASHGALE